MHSVRDIAVKTNNSIRSNVQIMHNIEDRLNKLKMNALEFSSNKTFEKIRKLSAKNLNIWSIDRTDSKHINMHSTKSNNSNSISYTKKKRYRPQTAGIKIKKKDNGVQEIRHFVTNRTDGNVLVNSVITETVKKQIVNMEKSEYSPVKVHKEIKVKK